MRDQGKSLRRVGGGRRRYSARVQRSNQAALSDVFSETDGAVYTQGRQHKTDAVRGSLHWRITKNRIGQIIAVGPRGSRGFSGDDPLMAAIEYAAEQLRKEMAGA